MNNYDVYTAKMAAQEGFGTNIEAYLRYARCQDMPLTLAMQQVQGEITSAGDIGLLEKHLSLLESVSRECSAFDIMLETGLLQDPFDPKKQELYRQRFKEREQRARRLVMPFFKEVYLKTTK